MSPCHRGDRFPRLAARLDDPKLLFRRPAPPTRRSSDQFNPLIVVRHRHVLEDIPKPSELCRVSGRNGGQFIGRAKVRVAIKLAESLGIIAIEETPPGGKRVIINRGIMSRC